MRKVLLYVFIIILFIGNTSFSDKNNETQLLYIKCLKMYAKKYQRTEIDILQNKVTDIIEIPSQIENLSVKIISLGDSISTKEPMNLLETMPIQIENNNLLIVISYYKYAPKDHTLAFSGSEKYYFKYDCNSKKYLFSKAVSVSF